MKLLFTLLGVGALGLAAAPYLCDCPCSEEDAPAADQRTSLTAPAPTGAYLEARNVTLWGGHCHLNGEYDHQGDAALVGWSFEAGAYGDVDLAGVRVVAAIASDENLAEGAARTAELFVDAPTEAQREAAFRWVCTEHAEQLGDVRSVSARAIEFERDGDAFRLAVDGLARLEGSAIADRSCCTMTEMRGYEPLMAEAGAVVGLATTCAFEGTDALAGWEYADANSVFVSDFDAARSCVGDCACDSDGADAKAPRP